MSKTIFIGGRLESKAKGNVVTGANAILDDTKGKKQNVINKETDDELLRLEQSKQNNLTFDNAPTENSTNPVTSGGVYTAEKALSDAIEAILLLIPSAATALNKLVDTNTMNSSISTATATFRGTYNAVSDLGLTYQATHAQIEAALDALGLTADNNDFAFVQIPVSDQSQDIAKTERFKFNGTNWLYEYDLNTSGFTAAQWAAINSTITLALVQKLAALPTNAELLQALGLKQDVLTFDNAPTMDSNNPVKSGGIKSAIDTAVGDEATARENADTALSGLIGDEKTRAEGVEGGLNTRFGAVEGSVSTIQAVIPSGATSSNKLVDNSSMITYIGTIIDNIDATFNVTSTDGHVTLAITQVNGVITSVQLTTSDIASAADLTLLAGRVTSAEGNITSLTTRMGTAETDIATLLALYNALQQSAPQVIEPTDTWPVANPSTTVIYRVIDRVNTPPEYYSDYMWNGTAFVLMATYNNAIDDVPTAGSNNLVKSGGVYDAIENVPNANIPVVYYDSSKGLYAENNGYINNSGVPVSTGDSYKYTNLVDISNAVKINVKANFSSAVYGIHFYDANGVYVGGIGKDPAVSGQTELEVAKNSFPTGAYYCRVNFYNYNVGYGGYYFTAENISILEQIEKLDSTIEDINSDINEIENSVVFESDLMPDEVTNYGLYTKTIADKYFVNGVLTDNAIFNATTMAKLDRDNDIYIYCSGDANSVVFFDKDKQYIAGSQIDGIKNSVPVLKSSFPVNAEYVAFSYSKGGMLTDIFATRNSYIPQMGWKIYSNIKKQKGTRPKINILTTDSETDILKKLVIAYITKDCDVTFEFGDYSFEQVYVDMVDVWEVGNVQGSWNRELPLGGNCSYDLGGSTITGTLPSGQSDGKIFGCVRVGGQSYKLFNGTLVSTNMVYCIHDDGQSGIDFDKSYIHEYFDLKLVGGTVCVFGVGTALSGAINIHECIFINDANVASIAGHGITNQSVTEKADFLLSIVNCWLSTSANVTSKIDSQTAKFVVTGCSVTSLYTQSDWDKYFWNNEIRQ